MTDREVLEMFLKYDLASSDEVFSKFRTLKDAQYYEYDGYPSCVYVPGKRNDRVVLVAHADTVFHKAGGHKIIFEDGTYRSVEQDNVTGIGADDRAGCAILWLLKDSGHSLLITNDEELGCLGSQAIKDYHKTLYAELNNHQYFIEFDRRNARDFKVYYIPVTNQFKQFIADKTGYEKAAPSSSTDITVLCDKICGVNLSVGYYREHTPYENLVYEEWQNTLYVVRKLLAEPQEKFLLLQD